METSAAHWPPKRAPIELSRPNTTNTVIRMRAQLWPLPRDIATITRITAIPITTRPEMKTPAVICPAETLVMPSWSRTLEISSRTFEFKVANPLNQDANTRDDVEDSRNPLQDNGDGQ